MSRLWSILRRELVFITLGAMDVCIITPLFAALLSAILPVQPVRITLLFLAAVLIAHYVARASLLVPLRPTLRAALLAVGMIVSGLVATNRVLYAEMGVFNPRWLLEIFAGVREANLRWLNLSQDVIVLLMVLFLWWRGLVLARRRLTSDSVAFRFRLGVVLIATTTLVSGLVLPWSFAGFILGFFFAGLVGIALARAEEVGQQHGGIASRFGPGWLLTLVATAAGVLVIAAGVAAILTGENLTRFVTPAWTVLRAIFSGIAYVVGWAAEILVTLVRLLIRDISLDAFRRDLSRLRRGLLRETQTPEPSRLTLEQLTAIRTASVVVGTGVLVVLIALSLRWLHRRAQERREDEHESVWEGLNLRRGLRELLQRGRQRLGDVVAALDGSVLSRLFAERTIRRIYAAMALLGRDRGHPRALFQTPYEYLPALRAAFPTCTDEVTLITEAYVAVHYGEVPEGPSALAEVQRAWQRVRDAAGVGP